MQEERCVASFDGAFQGAVDIQHPLFGRPLRAAQPVTREPFFYYRLPRDTATLLPQSLIALKELCHVAAVFRQEPSKHRVHHMWMYLLFDSRDAQKTEYWLPFQEKSNSMIVFNPFSAFYLAPNVTVVGHLIKSFRVMCEIDMDVNTYGFSSLVAVVRTANNNPILKEVYEDYQAVLEVGAERASAKFWYVKTIKDAVFNLTASAAGVLCSFRGTYQQIVDVFQSHTVTMMGKKRGYEEMQRHSDELARQLGQAVQVKDGCPHVSTYVEADKNGRKANKCNACHQYTS